MANAVLEAMYAKGYSTYSILNKTPNPRSGSYETMYIMTNGENLIFVYGEYDGREDCLYFHTISEPSKIGNAPHN